MEFPLPIGKWVHRWKRCAKRKWRGVNCQRGSGANVFVGDVVLWVGLAAVQQAEEGSAEEARGGREEKIIAQRKTDFQRLVERMAREQPQSHFVGGSRGGR